jgi:hypothetical protein
VYGRARYSGWYAEAVYRRELGPDKVWAEANHYSDSGIGSTVDSIYRFTGSKGSMLTEARRRRDAIVAGGCGLRHLGTRAPHPCRLTSECPTRYVAIADEDKARRRLNIASTLIRWVIHCFSAANGPRHSPLPVALAISLSFDIHRRR